MVGAGLGATFHIDLLVQCIADAELALRHPGAEGVKLAQWLRRILNFSSEAIE